MKKILCVDDDTDICAMLQVLLGVAGYSVQTAGSIEKGLSIARAEKFDLYLFDLRLPDGSGTQLCRETRLFDSETPIVIFTADAHRANTGELFAANVQAVLIKPQGIDELLPTINQLLKTQIVT